MWKDGYVLPALSILLHKCSGLAQSHTHIWSTWEASLSLTMVHLHRSHIIGFVTKAKEKSLLKKKQRGTFMLRFSESVVGGITFSWVDIDMNGQISFSVQWLKNATWWQLKIQNSKLAFFPLTKTFQPFLFVGEPEVNTVQPFTKVDLSQIPFHEIIRNFLILELGNIPENPLVYLYPNSPRDEAFGKYYSKKARGKSGIASFRQPLSWITAN